MSTDEKQQHDEDVVFRIKYLKQRIENLGKTTDTLAKRLENTAMLKQFKEQPELLRLHEEAVAKVEASFAEATALMNENPGLAEDRK